jgi:sialic acid synthase SpsE
VPLLAAAAATGLPLLISTGAAEIAEVDAAVELLEQHAARDRVVLLHCVSSYPTRESDVNLRRVAAMAARFRRPAGFSDHTTSTEIGGLAAAAGAVLLEKHITLDRRRAGPDHSFSLEPEPFARYVAGVRNAECMLGRGQFGVLDVEQEVRRLARSSVVAAAAIAAGQRVRRDMLTIKRPGSGIAPAELEHVVDRIAAVDIPADTPVCWEMLR